MPPPQQPVARTQAAGPGHPHLCLQRVQSHGVAVHCPQTLPQTHWLQDGSTAPFPWEHALGHRQNLSSAEQQQAAAAAFARSEQCCAEEPSRENITAETALPPAAGSEVSAQG